MKLPRRHAAFALFGLCLTIGAMFAVVRFHGWEVSARSYANYDDRPRETGECTGAMREATLSKYVVTDAETFVITATFKNPCWHTVEIPNDGSPIVEKLVGPLKCSIQGEVLSPKLELSPASIQKVDIEGICGEGRMTWVAAPRATGVFDVIVRESRDEFKRKVFVTDAFGLNVVQAKLLSLIVFFLGPSLTLPWILDRWKRRNDSSTPDTGQTSLSSTRAVVVAGSACWVVVASFVYFISLDPKSFLGPTLPEFAYSWLRTEPDRWYEQYEESGQPPKSMRFYESLRGHPAAIRTLSPIGYFATVASGPLFALLIRLVLRLAGIRVVITFSRAKDLRKTSDGDSSDA